MLKITDFVKKICNKRRNIQIDATKWSAIMSVQINQWTAISAFCSANGWWPTVILIPAGVEMRLFPTIILLKVTMCMLPDDRQIIFINTCLTDFYV